MICLLYGRETRRTKFASGHIILNIFINGCRYTIDSIDIGHTKWIMRNDAGQEINNYYHQKTTKYPTPPDSLIIDHLLSSYGLHVGHVSDLIDPKKCVQTLYGSIIEQVKSNLTPHDLGDQLLSFGLTHIKFKPQILNNQRKLVIQQKNKLIPNVITINEKSQNQIIVYLNQVFDFLQNEGDIPWDLSANLLGKYLWASKITYQ